MVQNPYIIDSTWKNSVFFRHKFGNLWFSESWYYLLIVKHIIYVATLSALSLSSSRALQGISCLERSGDQPRIIQLESSGDGIWNKSVQNTMSFYIMLPLTQILNRHLGFKMLMISFNLIVLKQGVGYRKVRCPSSWRLSALPGHAGEPNPIA